MAKRARSFSYKPDGLFATHDTWVSKDKDGAKVPVRVVDMETQHLYRWVMYFRKKYRAERGADLSDSVVDGMIWKSIITAPAIYAEGVKRGVLPASVLPVLIASGLDLFKAVETIPAAGVDRVKPVPAEQRGAEAVDIPLTLGDRKIELED